METDSKNSKTDRLLKDPLNETSRIQIDEQVNSIPELEGSLASETVTNLDATFTRTKDPMFDATKITPKKLMETPTVEAMNGP